MMATGWYRSLEEEYNLMLQLVRDHVMGRERAGQPLLLQIQRDGVDGGDHVTLVLGSVSSGQREVERRDSLQSGRSASVQGASLPFLAELGPLLLQTLALQVILGEQRRRMAAPLDQDAVGRLQRMRLRPEIVAQLEMEGQGVCSICQELFIAGVEVYRLPCGHMFDVECLRQWLGQTRTCPNCRFMLQDVEQQYKDVVTPVWWCSEGGNGDGIEGKEPQCVAPAETKSSDAVVVVEEEEEDSYQRICPLQTPEAFTSVNVDNVDNVDDISDHEEPHLYLHRMEEPPLSRAESSISDTNSTDGGALHFGRENEYDLFPTNYASEPGATTFTPVTPLQNPQRAGGVFRERLFTEEMAAPALAGCPREVPLEGRCNGNPSGQQSSCRRTEQPFPLTHRQESSFSPPNSWELAANSSPRLALHDTPSWTHSSFSGRTSNDNSEYDLSAHMPHMVPRPPDVVRTAHGIRVAHNTSSSGQGHPPACGNPRHAVQALRHHPLGEVGNSQVSNNSISYGATTVRPPRYGPGVVNRPIVHAPLLPSPPPPPSQHQQQHHPGFSMLRLSEERSRHYPHHNHMHDSTSSGEVQQRSERGGTRVRHQAPFRGNRHNLEEYETTIRGQPRR